MADTATVPRPAREIDNVLLRVPAGLRKRVAEKADEENLSQNVMIVACLVLATIMVCEIIKNLGSPKPAMTLLDEMDKAAVDRDSVLGSFDYLDWNHVEPLVESFRAGDLIYGLKTKTDALSKDTVAFTFNFSKPGAAAWKIISPPLRENIQYHYPVGS